MALPEETKEARDRLHQHGQVWLTGSPHQKQLGEDVATVIAALDAASGSLSIAAYPIKTSTSVSDEPAREELQAKVENLQASVLKLQQERDEARDALEAANALIDEYRTPAVPPAPTQENSASADTSDSIGNADDKPT